MTTQAVDSTYIQLEISSPAYALPIAMNVASPRGAGTTSASLQPAVDELFPASVSQFSFLFWKRLFNLMAIGFQTRKGTNFFPQTDVRTTTTAQQQQQQQRPILPHQAEVTTLVAGIFFFLIILTCIGFSVFVYVMNAGSQSFFDTIKANNEAWFLALVWQVSLLIVVVAVCNALTIFFGQHLSAVWRKNISDYIFERYFTGNVFYNMNVLDTSGVDNMDQRIATDVRYFTDNLCAFLFGSTAYYGAIPTFFTIIAFTISIALASGWIGIVVGWGSFIIFAVINTLLANWVSKARVQQEAGEAYYRFMNTHLRTHSEHVSFFRGQDEEKLKLTDRLDENLAKQRVVISRSLPLNTSAVTYSFCNQILAYAIPGLLFFYGPASFHDASGTNFLATMLNNKFLQDFLGYIISLSQVWTDTIPFVSRVGQLVELLDMHYEYEVQGLGNKDRLKRGSSIVFEHVDGFTPLKTLVVKDLSFAVQPQTNLIIMGPSGAGKSSILRYLAGLWPIANGFISRPETSLSRHRHKQQQHQPQATAEDKPEMFYLPQKPYLVLGSLREQIMYPTTIDDPLAAISDNQLVQLLTQVGLQYLLPRIKSPDVVMDWEHVLSVGEQQRIAMARLYFNRPRYAILDEATSAVDSEAETTFYKTCIELGITFISVAHRPDVIRFHHNMLYLEGNAAGAWRLLPVDFNPAMLRSPLQGSAAAALAATTTATATSTSTSS